MRRNSSISREVRLLPGKTSTKSPNLWLPAWVHMKDTAFIMKRLCRNWLSDSAKRVFPCGWDDTLSNDETVLESVCVFLAEIHDIGKMTPVFALKLLKSVPELSDRLNEAGFVLSPNSTFQHGKESPHALAGQSILLNAGFPDWMASVVGAHHGKPVSHVTTAKIKRQMLSRAENYYGIGGHISADASLWENSRNEWLSRAMEESCLPDPKCILEPNLSALVVLTGLLIMADWIASNPFYFPLKPLEEDGSGINFSRRGEEAWEHLGLTTPWHPASQPMDRDLFRTRFQPDDWVQKEFTPNAVQRTVIEAAEKTAKPGLMILEAQMGAGKTEAALAAAEIYASTVGSDGIFFGLPTQATANGIFPRLTDWLRHMISDDETWSVCLAHGAAALNEEYRTIFHGTAQTEEDREDADGLLVHLWMDRPKRNLLANFVVGTVDQFLLAALQQRHLMLRHLGLCGKVVIIDEVHAYDAYMDQYLFRAIQWMAVYGVPVILLSATLPEKLRKQLVNAYRHPFSDNLADIDPEDWKNSRDYPQITWTDGKSIQSVPIMLDTPKRFVTLERLVDTDMAAYLRRSLSGGGCAGIIVNTVKRAQDIWMQLRDDFKDYHVILLHARFLAPDRAALEEELMEKLGKKSTPAQRDRVIVVGTQVLEQSLDIDFDLLLTDLCPMDLLLQRIGRLHRHLRPRPAVLQQAHCAVLYAGDELESGAKSIYGDWLLERTKSILPEIVTLPDSIPELVQAVYADPDSNVLKDPKMQKAWERHARKREDMEDRADSYRLITPDGKMRELLETERDVGDERQGEAAVRDGEPALSVIVVVQYDDIHCGLVRWRKVVPSEESASNRSSAYEEEIEGFLTTNVPDDATCLQIAREQLRLPAWFSQKWMIDRVIAELKKRTYGLLVEWQQNPLLCGELFLILNQELETTLCNRHLRYDQSMRLVVEEEECDGKQDFQSAG